MTMTKEQWTELADRLDCVEANNLEEADVLFRASEAIREIWASCNLCGGEGGWEEASPQRDDPYFSVSIKCPSCGGTGWECE